MMIRDPMTKALIANDNDALNKYKAERKQSREVQRLSKELEEVRSMLRNICERIERIEKV
jgi:hypothetical protein